MSVAARDLQGLRNDLAPVMPARVGRVYQAGPIASSNLWTDNEPPRQSPPPDASVPMAYEMRWWALDRSGGEDDVVADALEFATERQARDALRRATSPRCRRDATVRAAPFPAGASNLFWVNPDNAAEWDVMFVRGRRLYRVGDVPPGYLLNTTTPEQGGLVRLRAGTTADLLACALPAAACPASATAVKGSSVGPLTAGMSAVRLPTRAEASAYAHAVNLHGYDVPGMSQVAPAGPTNDRGYWEAFVSCTGELRSAHALVAVRSPVFRYRDRLHTELVYSTVAVLPSSALARQYLAVLAGARARDCVVRRYGQALIDRTAGHSRLHPVRVTMTPLPTSAPASYRGPERYLATSPRLTILAGFTTARGRHAQLPLYTDGFVFVRGRAVVGLTAIAFVRPFPEVNERFLDATLVGRAEANE
jgi:hypothetical protein